MNKIALIILAAGDTHESLGRVVNALMAALEFVERGELVRIVFDGAGTEAAAELSAPDHKYHELFQKLRAAATVCSYCAEAYEVTDRIKKADLPLVDEFKGHPSYRNLFTAGFQVLTF